MKKKKSLAGRKSKFKFDYIWKAYALASDGMSHKAIAKHFGTTAITISSWKANHPAFKRAIEAGKQRHDTRSNTTLDEFIIGKLSPEAQDIWEYMGTCLSEETPMTRLETLINNKGGEKIRQQLWFQAWYACNFSVTEANRLTNTTTNQLTYWKKDPVFQQLFQELETVKGDFFESHLVSLVRKGDAMATVAANRTFNRQRGYGEKLDINHSGTIEQNHTHTIRIEELPLSLETRKEIYQAIQAKKEEEKTIEAKAITVGA